MRRTLLCLCLLAAATSAVPAAEPVDTRFGRLTPVVNEADNPYDDGIAVDGQPIPGVEGSYEVRKVIEWGDRGDVVLLEFWSGGASCCSSYQIVLTSPSGAMATPVFGDTAYDPKDFAANGDAVTFRLEREYPASLDHLDVAFDGRDVSVVEVAENDGAVAPAGAGQDVLRWKGAFPYAVLDDASERARFRTIMDDETLDDFRTALSVASEATVDGDHLIAEGCWPHQCDSRAAFFAISVSTGRPLAVTIDEGVVTVHGGTEGDIPPALRALIENYRQRTGN